MSNKNSTERIQEMYERVSGIKEAVGTKTPAPEDPEDSEGEQGKAQGKAQSKTDEQSRWRNAVWTAVLISFGIVLFFAALAQWLLPSLLPVNPAPEVFRDALKSGGEGPEMAVLPTGSFRMGSPSGEEGRRDNEGPLRTVTISRPIAMGRYEVTVSEFRRFVTASGYRTEAERNTGGDQGCWTLENTTRNKWGWTPGRFWLDLEYTVEEDQPVVCVSWNDAQRYIAWLNEETGGSYRLPSESEWEYAVRAGSGSRYHFGDDESKLCDYGNVADTTKLPNGHVWTNKANCSDDAVYPVAVGSYRPNAFGLYDLHGNVLEWVEDCYHESYEGAPTDGSAWTTGCDGEWAVVRGGAWNNGPQLLRAANRSWNWSSTRNNALGFRLVQDLNPSDPFPEAPTQAEAPGSLVLELAPSDARVILPDIESGYRPGMALPAGEYQVIVRQAGYEEFVGTVRIESGVRTTRSIVLRRARVVERAVGAVFRDALKDGGEGPEMVVLPPGRFRMGSPAGEEGRDSDEGPLRTVTIGKRIAMGRYEVTVGEFRRFVTASGYRTEAERNAGGEQGCYIQEFMDSNRDGWDWTPGRFWLDLEYTVEEDQPVVCVSWNDAQRYIAWLNEETGGSYRLPSESEWEYAVRAGSGSRYHFGDDESKLCDYGNVADTTKLPNGHVWTNKANCSDDAVYPVAVGSYRPNAFGLYDLHGNVLEWVEDCYHESYEGAPTDGSAWTTGCDGEWAVVRGGAWNNGPQLLRAAVRSWSRPSYRFINYGFRLVQDLNP